MAHDVLNIPLSTVASESAFSVGGRILDAFRSTLKPQIVEAVICLRDWVLGQEGTVSHSIIFNCISFIISSCSFSNSVFYFFGFLV